MVLPKHGITNPAKVSALAALMSDGWPSDMPPVLVAGDCEALTGTHRLAAARMAEIEPLTLDVQAAVDLLVERGYEWHDLICADDHELAAMWEEIGRPDLALLTTGERAESPV